MDNFFHSRFFRFLICIVLVCAILINCSPLRANAVVGTVVTGTAAAGILGLLFSMAMGVVFIDITEEMVSGIGQSVIDSVTNKYANDTETSNTVKEYFDDLSYTFGGSGDDGTGNGDGKTHILDGFILAGLVAWVSSLIKNDGVEVEKEVTAAEGYVYYNGYEYPGLPTEYEYQLAYILTSGNDTILTLCTTPGYYVEGQTQVSLKANDPTLYSFRFESGAWAYLKKNIYKGEVLLYGDVDNLIWISMDSEPSSTYNNTETVTPSTYVGDIPSQVKDDTFDEEKYRLPYIDYSKILPGLNDYVTELNNLAQQMANNTKTYEEYMKDIQTENKPESDPDPSEPSDPEETKPEEDEEDEEEEKELDMFTLDLSDYFPFCIPFDLYDFFSCLNADPVAPVIEWFVPLPGGGKYPLRIDLSAYDDVAQLLRRLQLLLFCVGLAFKTRDLIKG